MKYLFAGFLFAAALAIAGPEEDYKKALETSGSERSHLLNQALEGFLKDGDDVNAGNAFFELEQYPWSILYYARALKDHPSQPFVQKALKTAQEKIPLASFESPKKHWTQNQYFLFFFIFLCLALGAAACSIWFYREIFLGSLIGLSLVSLGFLLMAMWQHYFAPMPAIIVKASPLYRQENLQSGIVGDRPLFAGSLVYVIDIREEGKWIKIETKDGTIGYLPLKSLRII